MAKKTKKVIKEEEKNENTSSIAPANLGYSGNINITVKNGSRTISKGKYKNYGSVNLFRFFIYCLTGEYLAKAEQYRPYNIKLFNINEDKTPAEARQTLKTILTNSIAASEYITNNTTAVPEFVYNSEEAGEAASSKDSGSITLHFVIPASQIISSQSKFNCICLYRNISNLSGPDDYSAYFLLTTKDASGIESWNSTRLSSDKINLIIEWTLTVGNN